MLYSLLQPIQIEIVSDVIFINLYVINIVDITSTKNSWPSRSQNQEIQPDPDSLPSSSYKLSNNSRYYQFQVSKHKIYGSPDAYKGF